MERQKFERVIKEVVEKAESTPSEKVWTNIELDLERLETGNMKQRLVFFKVLAAASVVFALAVSGAGIYLLSTRVPQSPITEKLPGVSEKPMPGADLSKEGGIEASSDRSSVTKDESAVFKDSREANKETSGGTQIAVNKRNGPDNRNPLPERASIVNQASNETIGETLAPAIHAGKEGDGQFKLLTFIDRSLPALVRNRAYVLHFPKTEPDQIDLLLASIEMEEKKANEEKRFDGEKIWTSLGFSAGPFNNFNQGASISNSLTTTSQNLFSAANKSLSNETNASGIAYSVGLSVGGKITDRWVIQGGLNYLTQNSAFTSDAVLTADYQNFQAASSAEITKMADASARVVPTAPYEVNSSLQFLSIPIQAGYLIVNRSFGLQLNGGISTDLFLQNTLTPQSGNLEKVSSGRGSDSPYRSLNFSGLLGTEISYRFSDRYRVSLNPGIRYPFRSIYKSEIGLNATPLTFDVGLRFRYIFE
jgi:Outer membrane protein beta-barrel domain